MVKKLGVDPDYYYRKGAWDDKGLGSLFDANKKWAARMKGEGLFEEKLKGHAPKILWIGCSDARVPANEIIGEAPGSVFVHRNIANQVVSTDFNCMSVLQYAVDVLHVKHIIVCGHYDCGGVKAALVNADHKPPLENWLRNIRQLHQNYYPEIKAIEDPVARHRRMVEINTVEQCLNIFKTGAVQKRRASTYLESLKPGSLIKFSEPVVHAMVYEPTTGELKKLDVDFKKYLQEYADVFNLYTTENVPKDA
jgi:carbonic anhydrase